MKTELHWQQIHAAQAQSPSNRLGTGGLNSRPIDAEARRRLFSQMLTLDQADEDRRLSAAAAFSMFIFGFGCGAVWTVLLTWLL
jgi:hypothetical protein